MPAQEPVKSYSSRQTWEPTLTAEAKPETETYTQPPIAKTAIITRPHKTSSAIIPSTGAKLTNTPVAHMANTATGLGDPRCSRGIGPR